MTEDNDPTEEVRRQRDAVLEFMLHILDTEPFYFTDELLEAWPELAVQYPEHCQEDEEEDC